MYIEIIVSGNQLHLLILQQSKSVKVLFNDFMIDPKRHVHLFSKSSHATSMCQPFICLEITVGRSVCTVYMLIGLL